MTPVYIITIVLISVAVSSAAPTSKNDEAFVECMSKCLIGGDEHEHVTAVFKICKDSPTCWGEHLDGRVQRCASECNDTAPEEVLVWTALESSSLAESDVPEWVKCVAKCLGVSVAQLEEWYKECKRSKWCWYEKVGLRGLTCFRRCKGDKTTPMLLPDALESSFLAESDVLNWVKCVAKCLGVSVAQLEEWYKECKRSKWCWYKKVGLRGLTCFRRCKGDETIPVLLPDALESSFLAESDVPNWVKCVAKCLGVSVAQLEEWYKECKRNKWCWYKKVGLRGLTCLRKCRKGDETIPMLIPDVPIPSQSDIVKFASYEEFLEIIMNSKGTSSSMEMEFNGLDWTTQTF